MGWLHQNTKRKGYTFGVMKNIPWLSIVLVLGLFGYRRGALACRIDSTAKENVEIRVFNHDYRATVDEIHSLLERAKLEHRGFTKSAIKKSIASVDEQPIYTTTLHFDKTVPCKRLAFVEQEIRWLLPEVWSLDISKRVVSTVSRGMFNGGKICTAGIEIHLPPQRGYTRGIEKRETCYEWCLLCFHAATRN